MDENRGICVYDEVDMAIRLNLPLTLTEQTSSVSAGSVSVEAFGGEPVVILDSENILIPDSIGTRGELFVVKFH